MTAKQRDQIRLSATALAFFACAMWLALSTLNPRAVARQSPNPATALQDIAALLLPAELAVAGLSPAQVESIIGTVALEHAQTVVALRQSRQQCGQFAESLSAAQDTLLRGGATPERLAAQDAAQAGFDSAVAAQRTARTQLREAVYGGIAVAVGADSASLGERWSTNALRKVPDSFKVLDLSEDAWRMLEAAIRRTQRGESLTAPQAMALAAAQSSVASQLAQARLETHLGPVSGALAEIRDVDFSH